MTKPIFTPFSSIPFEAIIFDLGGVVINIDYNATIDAFKSLGIQNFEGLYSQAQQLNLFDAFEVGQTSASEFRDGIRALTGMALTDHQIDTAWHAMLLDFPPERASLLRAVRQNYSTYLLSNTNEIHFKAYLKGSKQGLGPEVRAELFDGEYYSHLIGKRKPNPDVFQHVLIQNNLNPNETLFIDDSLQHIEGARSVGIHAYHLDAANGETIESLFSRTDRRA